MTLDQKTCVPCRGGIPPLEPEEINTYKSRLKLGWEIVENKKMRYQFKFKDFNEAIKFVNDVASIAQKEDHHPDIHLTNWNKVALELSTHKIKGLHENDFILAAKIEKLLN